MNFCPDCESVLNLYIGEDHTLAEKCKNCGYQVQVDLNNTNPVYSNKINNDNLDTTYDILDNKFIIKDPTLPRLTNMKCINQDCLTNQKHKLLIVKNLKNLNREKFLSEFSTAIGKSLEHTEISTLDDFDSKKNLYDYGEIHSRNIFFEKNDIDKSLDIVELTNINLSQHVDIFLDPCVQTNSYFNDCIIDPSQDSPYIYPIDRQIVFIKYDSKNMKYMYICSTCATSWKNI